MKINIEQICKLKYPGQVEARNISFYAPEPENDVLIYFWNVDGVSKPKESELMSEASIWQPIFDMNNLKSQCISAIALKLNETAQSKSYDDAIACATYASSLHLKWSSEAKAFIGWRDSVWNYAYLMLAEVEHGEMPAPNIEEFIAGLPSIIWPE